MCDLCDNDMYVLPGGEKMPEGIAVDQPQPLSVLSKEITAQIGDIERHLDTERSERVRGELSDVMWGLRWAREALLCMLDRTRIWQKQPSTSELLARYPNPDKQPK